MNPVFVGLAGGSGAGKSTVAFALVDKHPENITIVHLDDYHKKRESLPLMNGVPNWDHPDAINFEQLVSDLQTLKGGNPIIVRTKNERFNPRAKEIGRLPMEIVPKPIIILEGYLALYNPEVRKLLDCKIFLDAPHDIRVKRRTKLLTPSYNEEILAPMHEQYVEPTKQYADYVIDVAPLSKEQLIAKVEQIVLKLLVK